ncbi:hypothetical protein P355_4761 [Burkholderia cenocepacia KC-01]|nr:hypothetical protein P355_4761 [Burkholderia cenocepacia KC-01]
MRTQPSRKRSMCRLVGGSTTAHRDSRSSLTAPVRSRMRG